MRRSPRSSPTPTTTRSACAGTVALHADDPDFRFVLIMPRAARPGRSPTRRSRPARRSARSGRPRTAVVGRARARARPARWLRLPRRRVADVPCDELVERIAAILREERPDVVVTFGPDGITGHEDHIAVGEAADRGVPPRCGPKARTGSAGCSTWRSRSRARRVERAAARARARSRWTRPSPISRAACPTSTIGVRRRLRASVVERKLAALARTPAPRPRLEDVLVEMRSDDASARETHVIAWPDRGTGRRRARPTSFEGSTDRRRA